MFFWKTGSFNDGFQDFRANPPPFETQKQEAVRSANLQTSLQVICSVAYGQRHVPGQQPPVMEVFGIASKTGRYMLSYRQPSWVLMLFEHLRYPTNPISNTSPTHLPRRSRKCDEPFVPSPGSVWESLGLALAEVLLFKTQKTDTTPSTRVRRKASPG